MAVGVGVAGAFIVCAAPLASRTITCAYVLCKHTTAGNTAHLRLPRHCRAAHCELRRAACVWPCVELARTVCARTTDLGSSPSSSGHSPHTRLKVLRRNVSLTVGHHHCFTLCAPLCSHLHALNDQNASQPRLFLETSRENTNAVNSSCPCNNLSQPTLFQRNPAVSTKPAAASIALVC